MTTQSGPTQGPARKGHRWINLTIGTPDGCTVTDRVEVTDDWMPTPTNRAPRPDPINPRTTSNPRPEQWKAMDRRTSYQTGCAWHACPNCESTTGLRRWYADNRERCWECGWTGQPKEPAAPRTKAIRNGAKHTVQPTVDRKALLRRYLEARAK